MRFSPWRYAIRAAIALACSTIGGLALAAPAVPQADATRAQTSDAPVVPGWNRIKDEGKASPAEQGQVLLGELNCLQCHAAPEAKRVLTKGAPDLSHAGQRLTPQYIRAFLADNHGVKPGTTMPDLFHASDAQAKQGAVDYLTHFLVSLGGPTTANEEGNTILVDQGRTLFHQVGCVACHAPEKNASTAVPSVPLPNLAEKTTAEQLTAFLLDPTKVRPASRMPNLNLNHAEARAIAVYLLREQLTNPQSKEAGPARSPGLTFTYYPNVQAHTAAVEQIDPLKPKGKATGKIDHFTLEFPGRKGNNNFAMKYTGAIHVPRDGKYTFRTTSDDGSRLYIGGRLVVDNDGVRPAAEKSGQIDLKEGDQPITVTYFQGGGEWVLKVEWEGPGINREEVPASALFTVGGQPMVPLHSEKFAVDRDKAAFGAKMFGAIGCVHCHNNVPGAGVATMRLIKTLAELNADAPTGCLGTEIPKSVPNYHLSNDQRTALKAAVKDAKGLNEPFEPKQEVAHTMAAFNCYACHVRNEVGGPTAERTPYFVMTAEFDMGDEGRFAPRLTGAGEKLKPEAMERIIFHNELHVRPVLATRMPSFSKDKAGNIVPALTKADAPNEDKTPAFDAVASKDGRTLVGTRGLGCVNCHSVNGVKSLGMPAPDLGTAHDRLRFGWFHGLLVNPPDKNPGTRMPAFWPNGDVSFKNVAGGTMDGQIAAIWMYLSLGQSMALPAGLTPSAGEELVPTDVPIVHRTMMAGVGNRSVAVGYPEMVHVAFDGDVVRLAEAWKGRFFDAKGMWESRGGQHLGPLGTDLLPMPPGPAIALLDKPDVAWPEVNAKFNTPETREKNRNLGGHFKGYVLDKDERPTFRYVLNDGSIEVQEQPLPMLKAGGADLRRVFHITAKQPVNGLTFLAAQGAKIEPKSPNEWVVDGKLTVRYIPDGSTGVGQPTVRDSDGKKQLLLPITLNNNAASFTVEMSW